MKKHTYRICHLSKYYPPTPGGIETHVQTLAKAQASLGAQVQVVCVNGLDEKGYASSRTKTIEQMDRDVRVTRLGRSLSFARFDVCPELLTKISQIASEPNTILHLHTPNPTMLTALVTLPKPVPLVITHHSDVIKQKVLKYGIRPFEHLVYTRSSHVLTTSPEYIEGSKFLKLYKENLSALPLGLDCSKYFHPSPTALAYANSLKEKYGDLLWLAVGRLVYYKALHIAIEALTMVPGKLLIVGVGSLEKELKNKAKQLGVENRIVWLGKVNEDELVGAYHAATAFWFPSNVRSEGFGLVQVEAMASGCPVINASIPCSGVPWVSRHELEGLTVPINNSVAFAEAANRILAERGLREKLVKAGRERALYFDHMTMAKRSFEIYEKVLTDEPNYMLLAEQVKI